MSVSDVTSALLSQTYSTSSTSSSDQSSLSVTDFYKLICAQLQNQDMYNTVDNTEFISQMAQMSTLSQMNEMCNNIGTNLSVSLLGKTVTAVSGSSKVTGTADAVSFSNGEPVVKVGSQYFTLDQIIGIVNTETSE